MGMVVVFLVVPLLSKVSYSWYIVPVIDRLCLWWQRWFVVVVVVVVTVEMVVLDGDKGSWWT